MTQQDKDRKVRTVEATVVGHITHNGKPATQLEIPSWGSKYPVTLYGIKEEHQAQLPINKTLTITLQSDRQKDKTDGDKPWHYFWSFVSIGTDDAPPASQPRSEPQRELPLQSNERDRASSTNYEHIWVNVTQFGEEYELLICQGCGKKRRGERIRVPGDRLCTSTPIDEE